MTFATPLALNGLQKGVLTVMENVILAAYVLKLAHSSFYTTSQQGRGVIFTSVSLDYELNR